MTQQQQAHEKETNQLTFNDQHVSRPTTTG